MFERPKFCGSCGAALPSDGLVCPSCQGLVNTAELEQLASQAKQAAALRQVELEIDLWRQMLTLLPEDSTQAAAIRNRISTIGADRREAEQNKTPEWAKKLGPVGAVLALLLSKAKFLFFGLGKMKTLFSMLATVGIYWNWYGWKFALGFVGGIYIHEMGHVWALRNYGLRASAPMFIPGFGAFVSLYDSPANESQDAHIGLAGPIWGTAAAIAALLCQGMAESGVWLAIARSTAFINLFNLIPVWQLDGGRGFRALGYTHRIWLLVLMGMLWYLSGEGMFLFLILGALYRIFMQKDHAAESDNGVLLRYAGLLIVLGGLLALIPVRQ